MTFAYFCYLSGIYFTYTYNTAKYEKEEFCPSPVLHNLPKWEKSIFDFILFLNRLFNNFICSEFFAVD